MVQPPGRELPLTRQQRAERWLAQRRDTLLARSPAVPVVSHDMMPYAEAREDEFLAPAERVPSVLSDVQRTRHRAHDSSQQAVWDRIAQDHPRRMRRAVRDMQWLDRMYERYSTRV